MADIPKAFIQSLGVPIGKFRDQNDKEVSVYATNEWRRPLELLANLVNEQRREIDELKARVP